MVRRRSGRRAAAWLAVLAYAWWVVSLPPFSGMAGAAVVATGVGGVVVGSARRRPDGRPLPVPTFAPWLALATVTCAWQLVAYLQQPRQDHPTLSSLTNALLGSHPARAAAFVLWLLAAVELGRR